MNFQPGKTMFSRYDGTLRHYMSDAMEEGVVYDAGKGWYSRIENKCELDRKPVAKIVKLLEKEFLLPEFTCWSTQQINPWMHHIFTNKFRNMASFFLF